MKHDTAPPVDAHDWDKPGLDLVEHALAHIGAWSFPPALEALYVLRCAPVRREQAARTIRIAGIMFMASSAIDAANDWSLAVDAAPLRAGVTLLVFGLATMLRSLGARPARAAESLLLLAVAMAMMLTTQFIGEHAGRMADRYMLAAVICVASISAVVPVKRISSIVASLGCLAAFPLMLWLQPLALPLRGNWDLTVFAVCIMGPACLIARRNEINRRLTFLLLLRRELDEIELKVMNQTLQRLSTTDPLTGLPNRRDFAAAFDRHWQAQQALGVALLDVDWFKSFNDIAGHAAGDGALQAVASAIAGVVRDGEAIAARYGGEEFVVLVHGCTGPELMEIGERLRRAVGALALPHPGRPGCSVSVSVGLSWCAPHDRASTTQADMLRDADQGLYAAKAQGRDCVVMLPARAKRDLVPASG